MLRTFRDVSRFTCGTVGLPGERTFYLQIRTGNVMISASLEKSQVSALGERLQFMLKEIRMVRPLSPRPNLIRDLQPLDIPVLDEFRIGSIAIFYDEDSDLIQIDLRQVDLGEFDLTDEDVDEDSPLLDEIQIVRIYISQDQARAFYDRAELVVAAGRQPCPFCGMPIDPQGHLCARANGYRR
ncbi:unannotated protein [freshwater metagenome]|uniref:Unannotated protein n=1 Tax=freshwater metagenome TaxID=449393 RepID=A0A6J7F3I7_9ZZZZ|nr:DUF3090 family protein [Actinomycetota bacterium]